MRKRIYRLQLILALGFFTTIAIAEDAEEPVTSVANNAAVLPLPSDMRSGAGIIRWLEDESYEQVRDSSNDFWCSLDDPTDDVFDVRCYSNSMWRLIARWRALRGQFETTVAVDEQFRREIDEGLLVIPSGPSAGYRMFGPISAIDLETRTVGPQMNDWQSIHFPYRTSEELGLTEEREIRQGDPMPFVMSSGTWWSHVMIMHAEWKPLDQ